MTLECALLIYTTVFKKIFKENEDVSNSIRRTF